MCHVGETMCFNALKHPTKPQIAPLEMYISKLCMPGLEQFEQEIGLAATSDAGDNLYQSVLLSIDELLQVVFSFYLHSLSSRLRSIFGYIATFSSQR